LKLLLNDRKIIIAIGSEIEYGVWGNIGTEASWKVNKNTFYADNNYSITNVPDDSIPSYVIPNAYIYSNGEFKLIDECPNEYRDKITENTEAIVTIENAMCETEIYSDERISAIEDALCELSTLLEI
jgi:hypothetical protein